MTVEENIGFHNHRLADDRLGWIAAVIHRRRNALDGDARRLDCRCALGTGLFAGRG
jgi:hypothetical protein